MELFKIDSKKGVIHDGFKSQEKAVELFASLKKEFLKNPTFFDISQYKNDLRILMDKDFNIPSIEFTGEALNVFMKLKKVASFPVRRYTPKEQANDLLRSYSALKLLSDSSPEYCYKFSVSGLRVEVLKILSRYLNVKINVCDSVDFEHQYYLVYSGVETRGVSFWFSSPNYPVKNLLT